MGTGRGARPAQAAPLPYALGRYRREGAAPISYSAVEREPERLPGKFGPPRPSSMAYPFHHLTNDELPRQAETGGRPGGMIGTGSNWRFTAVLNGM